MASIHRLSMRSDITFNILKRSLSSVSSTAINTGNGHYYYKDHMRAWTIPAFGSVEYMKLSDTVPVPVISHHKDVIVKVKAASVNPIDTEMVGGFGNTLLGLVRQCDNYLNNIENQKDSPLIPGRDFAGEVVSKGTSVRNDINVGDLVYGMVQAHHQGCHAELVMTRDHLVRPVPREANIHEAAAILYCGLTAWSALCITGDLLWSTKKGKKALVIGGAGGVGSLAVQLLKSWDMEVAATCRTDAIPLLERLGANVVIDYTTSDAMRKIETAGKFDIILDAAGQVTHYTYIPFLKDWANAKYITLRSPLLSNTDKYGIVGGMIKNATELVRSNFASGAPKRGATVRWGYVLPIETGVDELHNLFSQNKIKPIVSEVMPFNDLPKAYEKLKAGHSRGKLVISMEEPRINSQFVDTPIINPQFVDKPIINPPIK